MLKVLAVTNMYPSQERPDWGTFVRGQIEALKDHGLDVTVHVIDGYRSKSNYVKAISKIRKMCKEHDFDVVHAHYGLSGLVARFQLRVPVVVSFCGSDLLGNPGADSRPTMGSKVLALLHQGLSWFVFSNIVKSEEMAGLLPTKNVNVIPNGVDLRLFKPMDKVECRRQLGFSDTDLIVGFPAHKSRIRKNFKLLSEAVAIVNQRSGLTVKIESLHGIPHEKVPMFLNACDVLALCSLWEGSPNIVKEAMACNCSIVSTDVGDVAQLLDGVSAARISSFSASDFAESLAEMMATNEQSNGREKIQHLSSENVAHRVANVLNAAAQS